MRVNEVKCDAEKCPNVAEVAPTMVAPGWLSFSGQAAQYIGNAARFTLDLCPDHRAPLDAWISKKMPDWVVQKASTPVNQTAIATPAKTTAALEATPVTPVNG